MPLISPERKIRLILPLLRLMQAYMPLSMVRWAERQDSADIRLPDGIRHEVVSADGVRCEWFIPDTSPTDQVLLYLHGGGFVYGLSSLHRHMLAYLARRMGVRVLAVDYRLAPEHPFPAALDDCVAAYRWLLKQSISPRSLVMGGDSAGGNLTITTLMKLRDDGDPLPSAAVCLSPVIDLTDHTSLWQTEYDALLHPRAVRIYQQAYTAGCDPHNPLISPASGDWRGLPPLLIHAGDDELLKHDAVRAEHLATAAGVEVRLDIYPRMWHVWQIFLSVPQAVHSLDDIARFLQSHLPVRS